MTSCEPVFSATGRRKPPAPPLPGAFFTPTDLSVADLIVALAVVSGDLVASHRLGPSIHRRSSRSMLRKMKILFCFFEFLREDLEFRPFYALSTSWLLCLREFYILVHRCRMLMDYCAQASRLWLLLQSAQISGHFHDLSLEISTLLDVLPIEDLRLSLDVREQIELLRRQSGRSKPFIDPRDEFLRLKILSFIGEFEKGRVPDPGELRTTFVERLQIRNARACTAEIEFLEDRIRAQDEDADADPSVLSGVAALVRFCRFLLFRLEDDGEEQNQRNEVNRSKGNAAEAVVAVIPKDFCCPISLELMKDPVIVSTGQTYDRASITLWMNEGRSTCPSSGQPLVDAALIPNQALRSIISQWCAEHGVPYDDSESSEIVATTCSSSTAMKVNQYSVGILVEHLSNGSPEDKTVAARELRLLAKTGKENRAYIAEAGAIPLLKQLLRSENAVAQENSVTAILNLSIHDRNKAKIMEEDECLRSIVGVLRQGRTTESRENAAATLFSLSAVHEYKKVIAAEAGAVEALAGLLQEGTARGKRDAVMALFNLSTHTECCERMAESGAVSALTAALETEVVTEEAAGALALLVRRPALAELVGRDDRAVKALLGLMRRGTAKGKENAVTALHEMCRRGGAAMTRKVAMMPTLGGLVQSLMLTGTKRARRKAASLVRMCQKCDTAAVARNGSMRPVSGFAGGDVPVSVSVAISVPVL